MSNISITGGTFSDLSCLDYLASGADVTVKLDANATKNVVIPSNTDVTLDLNGKTINGKVVISNDAKLTVNDTSSGKTGAIIDTAFYGILVGNNKASASNARLTVNGGTIKGKYYAVSGNGTYDGTTIILNGGTLEATDESDSAGIYHPQEGTLEINDGVTIEGKVAVQMAAGTATINGGNLISTDTQTRSAPYKNPSESDGNVLDGSALSVLSRAGWGNVTVTVNGGTFQSNNGNTAVKLYGYEKMSEGWHVMETLPTSATLSITGGTFTSDPGAYVASGYAVSGSGPYTVYRPSSGGSSGGGTSTTTEKNPDGSTTTTVTKPDGSKTETTTNSTTDEATGAKTETKTETVTNKDGSKTETATETVTNKDGSKTETTTETKTDATGATTSTETVKATDTTGSTGTTTTTTNAAGETTVTAEATVTESAVTEAAKTGAVVTVPVEVPAATTTEAAAEVKISVPASAGSVTVEVPVTNTGVGVVAVIVKADGTEEIVKTSVPTENGVALNVEGNATVKIVDNSKSFNDVKTGDWHDNAVTFVSSREIMDGIGGNNFAPNTVLSRGMIAKVLHNFENNPETTANNLFNDVDDNTWYTEAVKWAAENKIVEGDGGNYAPNDNITREQLAAILYRYANVKGFDVTKTGDLGTYNDGANTSSWAQTAMEWAVANGILSGKGNNVLDPKGAASRAEVAQILMNFCTNVTK